MSELIQYKTEDINMISSELNILEIKGLNSMGSVLKIVQILQNPITNNKENEELKNKIK